MSNASGGDLDVEELLHVALHAASRDDHERAISCLKRATALAPGDARIAHMLGAEHAQLGLFDRAVQEMSRAVTLDPTMHTARFQLGLLHLNSGRADAADQTWSALDELPPTNALRLFKTGLMHVARSEFPDAAVALQQGIEQNTFNEALNVDMRGVLAHVAARMSTESASAGATDTTDSPTPRPVRLKAYSRHHSDDKS